VYQYLRRLKVNNYTNLNLLTDSVKFGLKRQHNLSAAQVSTNSLNTGLEQKSIDKFFNQTFNYNLINSANTVDHIKNIHYFNKTSNTINFSTNAINFLNYFNNNSFYLRKLLKYSSILDLINNNSDTKKIKYPLRKVLNNKLNSSEFNNAKVTKGLGFSDFTQSIFINETLSFFYNTNKLNRTLTTNSSNFSILNSDQLISKTSKISPNSQQLNYSTGLNICNSFMNTNSLQSLDCIFLKTKTN
jgi:hypothetical protein